MAKQKCQEEELIINPSALPDVCKMDSDPKLVSALQHILLFFLSVWIPALHFQTYGYSREIHGVIHFHCNVLTGYVEGRASYTEMFAFLCLEFVVFFFCFIVWVFFQHVTGKKQLVDGRKLPNTLKRRRNIFHE